MTKRELKEKCSEILDKIIERYEKDFQKKISFKCTLEEEDEFVVVFKSLHFYKITKTEDRDKKEEAFFRFYMKTMISAAKKGVDLYFYYEKDQLLAK